MTTANEIKAAKVTKVFFGKLRETGENGAKAVFNLRTADTACRFGRITVRSVVDQMNDAIAAGEKLECNDDRAIVVQGDDWMMAYITA